MNGKSFVATCLQCNERYEDWIVTIAGNTSAKQRASKSNRNIWAASHCERTGHVRFQIDDIDRHVAILNHLGPVRDDMIELLGDPADDQLTIEADENYGTIRLDPGGDQG